MMDLLEVLALCRTLEAGVSRGILAMMDEDPEAGVSRGILAMMDLTWRPVSLVASWRRWIFLLALVT